MHLKSDQPSALVFVDLSRFRLFPRFFLRTTPACRSLLLTKFLDFFGLLICHALNFLHFRWRCTSEWLKSNFFSLSNLTSSSLSFNPMTSLSRIKSSVSSPYSQDAANFFNLVTQLFTDSPFDCTHVVKTYHSYTTFLLGICCSSLCLLLQGLS